MGVAYAGRRHVGVRRKLVDAQHGARYHFRFRRKCLTAHVEEILLVRRSVGVMGRRSVVVVVARCNDDIQYANDVQ